MQSVSAENLVARQFQPFAVSRVGDDKPLY